MEEGPKPKEFAGICDFCNRKGEKASKSNLKGIILLSPDGFWICEDCLNKKKRKIIIGAG